jgi:hypothetical protein
MGGQAANGGGAGSGGSAGATGTGGASSAIGGASGTTGSGGASAGGASGSTSSGGTCTKGQTKPSEVLFIGDSFIALNNSIPMAIEADARAAGALGQSEHYRDNAVSGTTLANGQIPGQYTNAVNSNAVKVVLMDGGGNDCLQANDPGAAYSAAMSLFGTMAQHDTQSVIYFFYPDPLKTFAGGTLKTCLDGLRPMMKSLCDGSTKPKCYFIDLRAGWTEADTSDGIHPTAEGGKFVGDEVWAAMQSYCIAQ